ncbi:energy transducer TonB family protein [Roseovarius sp. 217]|uniref:energy transducer TonB family protein n=1 Tax=Roseovarius sp. (strain 217) TaxID=314264 RepID=UPI000068586F|nr:energy transducer TonB [Roseovarius sp. 217]EAQ27414.1 hypothetical protein ROS217_22847 [Roseovarius sp. 217]
MIRTSRSILFLSMATAVTLHGLGAWYVEASAEIETEGGAGASEVVLGSSFADMVAGSAQPATATKATPIRQTAQAAKPAEPDQAQAVPAPERPSSSPDVSQATEAALPDLRVKPSEITEPALPADTSQALAQSAPQEVLKAEPEPETGLQISRRPEARPREVEEEAAEMAARQAPEPEKKNETRKRSGNTATQDASRGSITGRETATAARAGRDTTSQSSAQGNAAASNYPGQVMRHLARVPRPRADTRGQALVQFSIAEGGRLASVSLARSSGSTRLDRAALTVVQRAAPFPAPPQGAQRSFSVQIKGHGVN